MLVPKNVFCLEKLVNALSNSGYTTGGVLLERTKEGTPYACATDGRAAVVATWREEKAYPLFGDLKIGEIPGFSAIVGKETCLGISKLRMSASALRSKPVLRQVRVEEALGDNPVTSVRIGSTDLRRQEITLAPVLAGRFLAWRDVIPQSSVSTGSGADGIHVQVNVQSLIKTLQAISTVVDSEYVVLSVRTADTGLLISSCCEDGGGLPQAVGVVMPWFDRKAPPPKSRWDVSQHQRSAPSSLLHQLQRRELRLRRSLGQSTEE